MKQGEPVWSAPGALHKLSGMQFKTMYALTSAVNASNAGVPAETIRTGF